jgi:hypothetical protein
MFSRKKEITSAFILFGIISAAVHFVLYVNVLDYAYSDDLLAYSNWYTAVSAFDDIAQIDIEGKDPGLSYLFYIISGVASSFDQFIFILSGYIVLFCVYISWDFSRGMSIKEKMLALYLLLVIILLNRLSLGQYTNSIRSFIAGSVLIFCYLKFLDKKYIWLLLLIPLFLVHKFQFLLFFLMVLVASIIPLKLLLITLFIAGVNLPFGTFAALLNSLLTEYLEILKAVYPSRILAEEMNFSLARKFQTFVFIIVPLITVVRSTIEKWKFKNSVSYIDRSVIRLTIVTVISFFLFVEVLPSSDRFLIFTFPLLFVLFVKHSSRNVAYVYSLVSILLAFVAIQRNIDNLIL